MEAARASAEATSPDSANSFTALVSAEINCITLCWALKSDWSLWSKPKFSNSSFSCTFAASPKLLKNSVGGSSCNSPSLGAASHTSLINSSTTSSVTATSFIASPRTSIDSVISSGAPAATNNVAAKSTLLESLSVKTAFAATSGVKFSLPSDNFSWVEALHV